MSKYLYGAAVQGIQNFIFQTNQLRDIVGASELVENICTTLFRKIVHESDDEYGNNSIIHAAGNIKHIFTDEKECKRIVREFPRKVVEYAPGITISQAVVELDDQKDFGEQVDELEKKLRAQRNKPMASTTIGLMAMHRNRNTGLPDVECVGEEHFDTATLAKCYHLEKGKIVRKRTTRKLCRVAFGTEDLDPKKIAYNIEDITDKNDWIAIVHADGNGLGQIVQKFGHDQEKFKKFSTDLDKNTKAAAVSAYQYIRKEDKLKDTEVIPIRPIVLGGDDFTVICRADLALNYVTKFIEEFEEKNKDYQLTACAGIAYIKSSFPFYYGYELAESLCSAAKNDTKELTKKLKKEYPASCIQFHKVQDSFVEDYQDIIKRELHPTENISFKFGPYYCGKQPIPAGRWSVTELQQCAKDLDSEEKEGNAVKSHIRQWLTLIHEGQTAKANQKLWRMKELYRGSEWEKRINKLTDNKVMRKEKDKNNKDIDVIYYPAYDVLVQHTINTQVTKETEDTKRKEETK